MAMSLVASTGGLAMLPASIEGYLPGSIVSRPLSGTQPTVDLVLGYHKANASPLLKTFLSKIDAIACQIYQPAHAEDQAGLQDGGASLASRGTRFYTPAQYCPVNLKGVG
jgi:hypothetical protein